MAGSMNKVIIVGNVGADPESRRTQNGNSVVNLRVATSESWKDKRSGEKQEKTEWHSIVIWNEGAAGFVEQYVQKGDKILIEGQLQTRKWEDKDGVERYTTEIVVQAFNGRVELLSSRDGGGRDNDNDRGGGRGRSRGRDDNDRDDDRSSRGRRSGRSDDRDERGGDRDDRDDRGGGRGRGRGGDRDDTQVSSGRGGSRSSSHLDDDIPF